MEIPHNLYLYALDHFRNIFYATRNCDKINIHYLTMQCLRLYRK